MSFFPGGDPEPGDKFSCDAIDPAFSHSPITALPDIANGGLSARVVIGDFAGLGSPVPTHSGTLYVDLMLAPRASAPFDAAWEERAIYVLEGSVQISGDQFADDRLLVLRPGDPTAITAGEDGARMVLLGEDSMGGKRHIWWNFVSSSNERIKQAKAEWRAGPFDIVPGDEEEFIPLPEK